jgi:uncharacterized protein YciI
MLFIVTLNYRRPAQEIDAHLEAHRGWLVANTRAGRIVLAGPLEPRTGGLLIVHCTDRSELDGLLALDPFVIHQLVDVGVLCVSPALRHEAFPVQWAPEAKSIPAA